MSTFSGDDRPFIPPRHTIDLSQPPQQRYKSLAAQYKPQLNDLIGLFDNLLLDLAVPKTWLPTINRLSSLLLRGVYDSEQNQELKGISEESGIPMYLLVAFNVVLDLLMGCTSGGVRTLERNQTSGQAKMLHFRTLDWTMDPLRKVVVQLDFIRSKSPTPAKIIASSVTYLGFVGILTGVTRGLSISLNFRAVHDASTKSAHLKFYFHHLLVLLGYRHSVGSILRKYLMQERRENHDSTVPQMIAADLESRHTTACYIILSDGATTLTMEKDYATAKIEQSSSFIAITNHDKKGDNSPAQPTTVDNAKSAVARKAAGLEELIEESTERLHCIQQKWDRKMKSAQRANGRVTRSQSRNSVPASDTSITQRELIEWLCDWPTTNECTHFAAILDPSLGEVTWSQAYPEPIQILNP